MRQQRLVSCPPSCTNMASVLRLLLAILDGLRFITRHHIKYYAGRLGLFITFLNRKLTVWRWFLGKQMSRKPRPTESPCPGPMARSTSSFGCSDNLRECASTVPASASQPILHEHEEVQLVSAAPTIGLPPAPASLSDDCPQPLNPPHPLSRRSLVNRSSGNLSTLTTHSRADDRASAIANSRQSMHAIVGQILQPPRAGHLQFEGYPDTSHSRECQPRPSSPPSRPHLIHQHSHIEIVTTDLPFSAHGESVHGNCEGQSSTSVVVEIQNPAIDSLPISSSTYLPQLADEPFAIDSATFHSPPADLHDESSQDSPIISSPTSGYSLPEGRFVQLIHSDQVPRYTKDDTVQVDYTIVLTFPLHLLTDPARSYLSMWQP